MQRTKNRVRGWLIVAALVSASVSYTDTARAGYDPIMEDDAATSMSEMQAMNRALLIRTLSEEMTEIQHLAAQQVRFRQMNNERGTSVARMYGRWIREHKAGGQVLVRLIRAHGGDPTEAEILTPAVLSNDATVMLRATALEHVAAINTSQMRYMQTNDRAIKNMMHKRANMARMHLRELSRFYTL